MVILLQCGVMVSMFTSGIVNHGFQLRLGKTKVHKIGICCFSVKHAVLKSKSKDWLAWNLDNVPWWDNISTHGLLFQLAITIHLGLLV